jgi:hypothetical protein
VIFFFRTVARFILLIFFSHIFFRTGTYEVCEAENVQRGTKVVAHLKGNCYDFAKEDTIRGYFPLLLLLLLLLWLTAPLHGFEDLYLLPFSSQF